MGIQCTLTWTDGKWTKEEIMVYSNFNEAEGEWVETRMAAYKAAEAIA